MMDQDHREWLEGLADDQLETESVITVDLGDRVILFYSHADAVRAAHAILSEVEIAQRGETPE